MTPEEAAIVRLGREITARESRTRRASRPKAERKIQHKRAEPVAKGQRQPRKRDRGYLGFIGELFCIATKVRTGAEVYGVERCHVRFSLAEADAVNPGKQAKPDDFRTLPMVSAEHHAQHMRGDEEAFWNALNIRPYDLIADLRSAYPDREAAKAVLRDHAARARSSIHSRREA